LRVAEPSQDRDLLLPSLERADVISLSAPPLLSPARLRVIFFALGMAVALAALEQTIVSTALASISSDLTGGDDQVSHS
jgi:Na+/H+ antiporter NhaD/arsenite permease-like protein